MREARILLIDGQEGEGDLGSLDKELLASDVVHVSLARSANEIYAFMSEHIVVPDIVVINGSASFPDSVGVSHLPVSPYRAGIEFSERWLKPVILCEPSATNDQLDRMRSNYAHRANKPTDASDFIAASNKTVLEEIAFLTRILPDLQPIPLAKNSFPATPWNPQEKPGEHLHQAPSFFTHINEDIRERFEAFLAGREAAKR